MSSENSIITEGLTPSLDVPSSSTSRTSRSPSPSSSIVSLNENKVLKRLADQLSNIFYEGNQSGQEDSEVERNIINHIHKSHFEPVQVFRWLSKNKDTFQYQSLLGYFYGHEIGVEVDKRKAYTFFLNAAKKNDNLAQYFVGASYLEGSGAKQDYELAFRWFEKAANGGCSNGLCALGYCYLNGYGVFKDELKGVTFYKKAIEAGNNYAMNRLGYCYQYGKGTKRDSRKAFEMYLKSAEKGCDSGAHDVAECYRKGIGTEVNLEQAEYWEEKYRASLIYVSLTYFTSSTS
ncbi:13622_t:CDS:1 [Acaulospora colombiana]|uniref:13622_t:CDS:1 n=1 Tax=Acaulospora colombiana TaxID=27376 RepID=A0ACA9LNX6_9GLOM|nr:13622_t:CDS:1 [Acaulospora colombiana]